MFQAISEHFQVQIVKYLAGSTISSFKLVNHCYVMVMASTSQKCHRSGSRSMSSEGEGPNFEDLGVEFLGEGESEILVLSRGRGLDPSARTVLGGGV